MQRQEIKGKFKARLFLPAVRFRFHRRKGGGRKCDNVFIRRSNFIAFPSALSLSVKKGRRFDNPKLRVAHGTSRPNNLTSVCLSLSLSHTYTAISRPVILSTFIKQFFLSEKSFSNQEHCKINILSVLREQRIVSDSNYKIGGFFVSLLFYQSNVRGIANVDSLTCLM